MGCSGIRWKRSKSGVEVQVSLKLVAGLGLCTDDLGNRMRGRAGNGKDDDWVGR
jgi:hypothetical protein